MKYLDAEHLNPFLDRIRQISSVSAGHPFLKFVLSDGEIVEGRYEGVSLGINGNGFHSLAALIEIPDTDYPRSVELVDVVKVEAVKWFPSNEEEAKQKNSN